VWDSPSQPFHASLPRPTPPPPPHLSGPPKQNTTTFFFPPAPQGGGGGGGGESHSHQSPTTQLNYALQVCISRRKLFKEVRSPPSIYKFPSHFLRSKELEVRDKFPAHFLSPSVITGCVCHFLFFGILCLPSPQPPSSPPPVRYWLARSPAVRRRRRRSQLAAEPGTPGLPQRRRRRRSWLAKRAEHFIYIAIPVYSYRVPVWNPGDR